MSEFLQFLFSGITVGATYALAALGFTLIYNASTVINFAQGEFIMLGGMLTFVFLQSGIPMPLAILLAIAIPALVGIALEKLAIEPARDAEVVTLIIITIGASLVIRGLIQIWLGKGAHTYPAFSGNEPIQIGGATLLPQSLWVPGIPALVVIALWYFFSRTLAGKAILATSCNPLAAKLVGIMLGLKGLVAVVVGGLGSGLGAVVGGLLVGVIEAMAAGYISSAYKDAIPFILILFILFFMPRGIFGAKVTERV